MLGGMTHRMTMLMAGLVAGCGSVAPKQPDAGPADSTVDTPAAACDPTKPFAPAVEVPGIRDPAAIDVHATLTADELTMYFASNRLDHKQVMHIYSATRPSLTAPFGTPVLVGALFSDQGESHPSVSPDGNTIYFDSYRVTAGTVHIFASTRANASVVFPTPTMINGDFVISPSITDDGKVLYVSNLSTGLLSRMDRVGVGFGAPQTVALQTQFSVTAPVSRDDLTLYLSLGDTTGNEIQVTRRASTSAAWPAPAQVSELHIVSTQAEPSWISSDGCRLYLTYAVSTGNPIIYMASRPK